MLTSFIVAAWVAVSQIVGPPPLPPVYSVPKLIHDPVEVSPISQPCPK